MEKYLASLIKMSKTIRQEKKRQELKNVEETIFTSKETRDLIFLFQKAQEDFNFIISHFPKDEEKKDKYRTLLLNAKKNMDNNELVKKYNDLYQEITTPTIYLENELKKIIDNEDNNIC